MCPDEFDRLVAAALRPHPGAFPQAAEERGPGRGTRAPSAQLARAGRAPNRHHTLLGLYEGRPLTHAQRLRAVRHARPHHHFPRPPRAPGGSPEHLVRLVEDTVWHEVAHYFGMNEREVRAAERRRRNRPSD